jgi:hypothetical protein
MTSIFKFLLPICLLLALMVASLGFAPKSAFSGVNKKTAQLAPLPRAPYNHQTKFALLASTNGQSFLSWYNHMLNTKTYLTKIVTSGLVGGLGDVLIQLVTCYRAKKPYVIDMRRLIVFSSVAAIYIAPVIHVWFDYLEKMPLPPAIKESPLKKSLVMILLDQTFGAVVVSAGFFYAFELAQRLVPMGLPQSLSIPSLSSLGLFLRQAIEAGTKANQNSLWLTLVGNWTCWPLINWVNFRFVPAQYRVLFSNLAAVFWNMFLSSVANK